MRARTCLLPTLAMVVGLAAPALGDVVSDRRATCEPIATIVRASCVVEQIFDCPDGQQYSETHVPQRFVRAMLGADDGSSWLLLDGATGQALASGVGVGPAFSLEELERTGQAVVALEGSFLVPSAPPQAMTATTIYTLTGEERVIGPVTFLVAETTTSGTIEGLGPLPDEQGFALVNVKRGLLLTEAPPESADQLSTRVLDVVLPGEPGFMENSVPECDGRLGKEEQVDG